MSTDTTSRSSDTRPAVVLQSDIIKSSGARVALAAGRLIIGFYFLWAFLDKLFGLRYSTMPAQSWLNGGTPAQGFIAHVEGPFAGFFQLFQNPFGDVLFMFGLLGIGVAMIAGAGLRVAAVGGALLLLFMYLAELPGPSAMVDGQLVRGATNPILDAHWMDAALLIISALTLSGDTWGLGRWWARQPIVRRMPWLR